MLDTLVIGKGPAGISAAIYLKRYNKNVEVVGKDYGALETKTTIDNYYGVINIDGRELIEKGILQAQSFGINVNTDEITEIEFADEYFIVHGANKKYETKTIVLSMGKSRVKIKAKNLKDYEGKGISYCVTCDGFFYRNKHVGIIGSTNYMLQELSHLEDVTDDITIFTDGKDIEYSGKHKVVKDKIKSFYGDEYLKGLSTDSENFDLDGVFVAAGSASGSDFAQHLGLELDEKNNIIVDENFMTNIPGIFAAGDVIGGLLQVVKAANDGAQTAVAIRSYFLEQKK